MQLFIIIGVYGSMVPFFSFEFIITIQSFWGGLDAIDSSRVQGLKRLEVK